MFVKCVGQEVSQRIVEDWFIRFGSLNDYMSNYEDNDAIRDTDEESLLGEDGSAYALPNRRYAFCFSEVDDSFDWQRNQDEFLNNKLPLSPDYWLVINDLEQLLAKVTSLCNDALAGRKHSVNKYKITYYDKIESVEWLYPVYAYKPARYEFQKEHRIVIDRNCSDVWMDAIYLKVLNGFWRQCITPLGKFPSLGKFP